MGVKWAALVIGIVAGYLSLVGENIGKSEPALRAFYAKMLAADFAGARKSIDEAIRLWPENARYYTWRGYRVSQALAPQCERNPKRSALVGEAATDYARALELNDRDAVAHHNAAWLAHLGGNDAAARAEWGRAIALDPANAIYRVSYGMFLEEKGDVSEATRNYAAAVELAPGIVDSPFFARYAARNGRGAAGVLSQAAADLRMRLGSGHDPVVEARLGKLYLHERDLESASVMLLDASRELPGLPLVWMNLGDLHQANGRREEAMRSYEKARLLDTGLPGPHLRIARLLLARGALDRAGEEFRMAASRWVRMEPATAGHNGRLYGGPPQQIDDLLPTTLVWYVSPCEASAIYRGLAELSPGSRKYVQRSRTCEELPDPHLF